MFEFLRNLKTFTLPWTTKALIVVLLLASVTLNAGLFLYSWNQKRTDLMSATVQFFGTMLPVLLVTIILARASTGVVALRRRTEAFFLTVLPAILARVAEAPGDFYLPSPRRRPQARTGEGSVLVNLTRGDCCGDILIYAQDGPGAWRAMLLRLEINISRANLNICIPEDLVLGGCDDLAVAGSQLLNRLRHTLGGAKAGQGSGDGYSFLDTPLRRTLLGQPMICLVGSRRLVDDFLWDSAAQLQFAQDLMFMARALLSEAPEFFPRVLSPERPRSAEPFRAAIAPPAAEGV